MKKFPFCLSKEAMAMKRTDDSTTAAIVAEIEAKVQEMLKDLEELWSTRPARRNAGDGLDW